MSYQVLARKYRPTNFRELEGQEHVLQALMNALDNDRLHHAYLFTGTRGVGKTTIARILARCLNCEKGVTSDPCGTCNTCREISEGRSVDLIEVDAASRTGVDDMRELLDNVQYMPTVSRFKIYLIDEVHMLSKSSFNAMLKTLEEPPEHVKFLFATTDPKKLPITVLSRCLQFNLKNLSPEQIVRHLGVVLDKESIAWEEAALWQLGRAADGSMRDALSLTDQAISFGNNQVSDQPVREMLGSIDHQEVFDLLNAVIAEDGKQLLDKVVELSEFAPDYSALLDDLLSVLHRIAIAHAVPDAVDNAQGDRDLVMAAASRVSPEQVQLLYQIALIGQRDLPLAPQPRIGFEMVLLRMMSFVPQDTRTPDVTSGPARGAGSTTGKPAVTADPVPSTPSSPVASLLSAIKGEPEAPPASAGANHSPASTAPVSASDQAVTVETPAPENLNPENVRPAKKNPEKSRIEAQTVELSAPAPAAAVTQPGHPESSRDSQHLTPDSEPAAVPALGQQNWFAILQVLSLTGVTATLAANCLLERVENDTCFLKLGENHASLWNSTHEQRIAGALSDIYGRSVRVSIEVGETTDETPAQQAERQREESQARAVADIEADEGVRQLIEKFNGRLDPASIAPLS